MFLQARTYIAELLRPISCHIIIKKNADSNAGLYAGSGLQILFTGNVGIEIINSSKCSSMGTRQEFNCNFNLGGIEFNSDFHRLVTTCEGLQPEESRRRWRTFSGKSFPNQEYQSERNR